MEKLFTAFDVITNKWASFKNGIEKRRRDNARADLSLDRDRLSLAKQSKDLNKKDYTVVYIISGIIALLTLLILAFKR